MMDIEATRGVIVVGESAPASGDFFYFGTNAMQRHMKRATEAALGEPDVHSPRRSGISCKAPGRSRFSNFQGIFEPGRPLDILPVAFSRRDYRERTLLAEEIFP